MRAIITSGFAGRVRQARGLNTYFNTKLGTWVTRAAKQSSGTITPARLAAQERFKTMVQLVKYASGEDIASAYADAKGTPFLPRDILMKNVAGTYYEVTDQDGNVWLSTREVQVNISTMLDSISNIPGSMLVRGDSSWMSVLAGAAGQVLTIDFTSGKPKWAFASAINGKGYTVDMFTTPVTAVRTGATQAQQYTCQVPLTVRSLLFYIDQVNTWQYRARMYRVNGSRVIQAINDTAGTLTASATATGWTEFIFGTPQDMAVGEIWMLALSQINQTNTTSPTKQFGGGAFRIPAVTVGLTFPTSKNNPIVGDAFGGGVSGTMLGGLEWQLKN